MVLSSVPRLFNNTSNRYLLAKLTLICMNFLAGYVWMRHNILGIRKPGWNLSWGYAKDLQREVSNLWGGGVAFKDFFCPFSGGFDAADIWIWSCKELRPLEFNCAEYWVPHSSQHLFRCWKAIHNSRELFSFCFVFSWLYSTQVFFDLYSITGVRNVPFKLRHCF